MRGRITIEGKTFLRAVLQRFYGPSEENPLSRAVLDSTYFLHPDVVLQTNGLPIIRARRSAPGERKNTLSPDGDFVSDNFPPDYVFRAAMDHKREQGSTQLSHIYGGNGEARDTFYYTNLANLCLMPSFLAKLADTDPGTVALLKRCAYVLYGFNPRGELTPADADAELRRRLKIASPIRRPLYEQLKRLRNADFLRARAAGFLFRADGRIDEAHPWVSAMLSRCGSRTSAASS